MRSAAVRAAMPDDFDAVLALNAGEVVNTSAMDRARLQWIAGMSAYFRVVDHGGQVAAFLLALREGTAYDSDNYRWFDARYPRFLYVDRIVVSATVAGRGLGSTLYRDLFAVARATGAERIACEYNLEPPNPASRAFHDKFGFAEVGTQTLAGGKRVSLQVAELAQ